MIIILILVFLFLVVVLFVLDLFALYVCKLYKCIVSSFAKCINLYEREVCLHQNVGQIHVHFT